MKQKYIIFFLFVILIFIIFKYSFVNLNFFVSKDIIWKVRNVEHLDAQMGSDHCPIILEIDL